MSVRLSKLSWYTVMGEAAKLPTALALDRHHGGDNL